MAAARWHRSLLRGRHHLPASSAAFRNDREPPHIGCQCRPWTVTGHVLAAGVGLHDGDKSAGQRLGEKRQALVHPVIDTGVVVGELLIAMRNAKLAQPPHEPTGAVEQVELILLTAVDVKCLQPAEIAPPGFRSQPQGLAATNSPSVPR